MNSLVIVALPQKDDRVYKISSEKVPHLTLLFLGEDATKVKNLAQIMDFTNHAASTSLMRFGLEVDRRGELGPDKADVLFFSRSKWSGYETIRDFRSNLLKNDAIKTAYDSAEQFPVWVPHLTLGFPDKPAKPDESDFPGISYVSFDRIAVWFGDYEGIEFPLKAYDWDTDIAMSDSRGIVANILSHHGVKGMRWGVRSRSAGVEAVSVTDKRKRIKTSGGRGHPASSDAVRVRTIGQVGKKSGLKALSNEELQAYNQRLNLEQQAKRLSYNDKSPPKKFVLTLLGQTGKQQASEAANTVASQQVKKLLAKAA
jgi:2'-5' RNA ligase